MIRSYRRRHARFKVEDMTVSFKSSGLFSILKIQTGKSRLRVHEMGKGGFGFISEKNFRVNSELTAVLESRNLEKPVTVRVSIRWNVYVEPKNSKAPFFKLGVKFMEFEEDGREVIEKYIDAYYDKKYSVHNQFARAD